MDQRGLERVDLTVSRMALGKELTGRPPFEDRIAVLEASVADIAGIEVVVTDRQLLVDIAEGYHVVIMGADKWAQVQDPGFYGDSADARDQAVAALMQLELAIAPRPPSRFRLAPNWTSPPSWRRCRPAACGRAGWNG